MQVYSNNFSSVVNTFCNSERTMMWHRYWKLYLRIDTFHNILKSYVMFDLNYGITFYNVDTFHRSIFHAETKFNKYFTKKHFTIMNTWCKINKNEFFQCLYLYFTKKLNENTSRSNEIIKKILDIFKFFLNVYPQFN